MRRHGCNSNMDRPSGRLEPKRPTACLGVIWTRFEVSEVGGVFLSIGNKGMLLLSPVMFSHDKSDCMRRAGETKFRLRLSPRFN